jgi:hypothetical protein
VAVSAKGGGCERHPHAGVAAAFEEAVHTAGEADFSGLVAAQVSSAEEAVHGEAALSGVGATEEIAAVETVHGGDKSQSSEEPDMQIIVRTITGIFHVLSVTPGESIGGLKLKIWRRTRKRPERQRLVCAGRSLCPEASTLQDHGIVDESVIHLVWDMSPYLRLFIMSSLDGGFYQLLTHPDETVRDVKESILAKESIPVRLQRLSFSGQILDDGYRLSCYSTLVSGCTLVLQLHVHMCTIPRQADFRD